MFDSGFQKKKFPRFRNPDSLTKGEISCFLNKTTQIRTVMNPNEAWASNIWIRIKKDYRECNTSLQVDLGKNQVHEINYWWYYLQRIVANFSQCNSTRYNIAMIKTKSVYNHNKNSNEFPLKFSLRSGGWIDHFSHK